MQDRRRPIVESLCGLVFPIAVFTKTESFANGAYERQETTAYSMNPS